MAFVHLHAHTAYSLLDASNKINEYVKRVKELGMDACASTYSDDRYYHLVLLAENNTGYQNLIKIVSRGYTEGY